MMTLPPGAFLFLRHGQTRANADDIICGRTDLPLTPAGQEQARQAAAFLQGTRLRQIVVSPLLRARQTAQPAAEVLGLAPRIVDDLAERDWGAWEGQPRTMLQREATPPGGESPQGFATRIRAGLEQIDLSIPTLIVAHAGTGREVHALLHRSPPPRLTNAQIVMWQPSGQGWEYHEYFRPGL